MDRYHKRDAQLVYNEFIKGNKRKEGDRMIKEGTKVDRNRESAYPQLIIVSEV